MWFINIQNNIIKGNLASLNQFSAGIFSDSNVIVRGNEIYGGVSNYVTYGIMNGFNSTPLIYNNIIHSGKATEGKDGWGTIGIYIDNADSIIQNNYIIGEEILWDTGVCREIGIFINNSYNTIIENNIILTKASVTEAKRIGISSTTNIASLCLKNNNIIDCPTALYEFLNDSPITDITKLNECTFASGNISLDPIFADKERGNYHLTASSPVEVRQGGLDLSAQFADDKDGNTRTTMVTGSPTNEGAAGWSMGAYECDEN